jgi:hypothetical protein
MFSSQQYRQCLKAARDPNCVVLSAREMTALCAAVQGCCICGNREAPYRIFPGTQRDSLKVFDRTRRLPICARHTRRQWVRRTVLLAVVAVFPLMQWADIEMQKRNP